MGRLTGTSAVPQIADRLCAPRKSAEVGEFRTFAALLGGSTGGARIKVLYFASLALHLVRQFDFPRPRNFTYIHTKAPARLMLGRSSAIRDLRGRNQA